MARSGSGRQSAASGSPTGGPSASRPSRPAVKGGYPLAGPSSLPDPEFHAFRQDLADAALAGRVIASHYAEPVLRHLATAAPFRTAAEDSADMIAELQPGDELWMLDDTRGWAWGYGGPDRKVGFVRVEALQP